MSTAPARRVTRSSDRLLTGVAGGYADAWRVERTVVRAAIGLLSLAGGIGIALYAVGLVTSGPPTDVASDRPNAASTDRNRELAIGVGTLAVLMAARWIGLWPGDGIMIPASIVAIAVAVIWNPDPAIDAHGQAWVSVATGPIGRVLVGTVLAIAGIASLADRTGGLADVGRSAGAIAVAIAGLVVIGAPAFGRLVGRLDEERMLRVREEERAALAAHLHDSVLQSLVLIQRADDPRRMVGLARTQERELRAWLYGHKPLGEPTTLAAAVEAVAAAIEVDHNVRIDVVSVGDVPLGDTGRAVVGAIREATTNAARHAKVDHVDVYLEVEQRELVAFVRDTGVGFDPAGVADDRHGLADSIIGRVERVGGRATVASRTSAGTEVEIRVPRSSPRPIVATS